MRVVLREHSVTAAVSLSNEQVAALLTAGAQLSLSPSPGRAGAYDITAGSCVGALHVAGLDIEIRPKVPVANLMFLLSFASEHKRTPPTSATVSATATIHEEVAAWFDHLLAPALRRGVLQGYREREEARLALRGRPLFDAQLRERPGQQLPHACRFDDFTEDTQQNRVLRAALRRLAAMPLLSAALRRRLAAHDAALERVRVVSYDPRSLPDLPSDRLNQHYRPALELALLILANQGLGLRTGPYAVTALLFDMNLVFEAFVYRALRQLLRLGASAFPRQGKGKALYLDRARRIHLRPDLSWWRHGRCLWIGDAKYKHVDPGREPNADFYQVLAYCQAASIHHATLIYASDHEATQTVEVAGEDIRIEVARINLSAPVDELLRGLTKLAERVQRASIHADRSAS